MMVEKKKKKKKMMMMMMMMMKRGIEWIGEKEEGIDLRSFEWVIGKLNSVEKQVEKQE